MRKHIKRKAEFRAENLKGLTEQRATLVEEMQKIVNDAKAEKRAMSKEEIDKFNELDEKIKGISCSNS